MNNTKEPNKSIRNNLEGLSENNGIPYDTFVEFVEKIVCDELKIEDIDNGVWLCRPIYGKIQHGKYLLFRDYETMKVYVSEYTKSLFIDARSMIIDKTENMEWIRRRMEKVLNDDWLNKITEDVITSCDARIYDDRFHQMCNGWIRCRID